MVGNCISLFRSSFLTDLLRIISLPGDGIVAPTVLVILAAFIIYIYKKDKVFAFMLLLAPLVGDTIKYLLKGYYQIPRPWVFGCDMLTSAYDQYSFPSGHTIFYTIFFGLLAYYSWKHIRERWAKILLPISAIFILLVGYSRVYLGAHWYLDVVGGYIVGGAVLGVAILIYEYLWRIDGTR